MNIVLGNALLLIFTIVEILIRVGFKKEKLPWREIVFNMNSGHILLWIFRGVELMIYSMFSSYFNTHILDGFNLITLWIFSFILWDFCFYWLHRLHHKIKLLWAVHVVHHQGEHYGLSLGIRNSWYSSLTSWPFFIGLAIIGVPPEICFTVSSIHYFIQFYNHNGIVKDSGVLEYFMITPKHHKVHHGYNDIYIDKNFGGSFVIWDKLFGTYQNLLDEETIKIGTKDYVKSHEVIFANNLPFADLFKRKIRKAKNIYPIAIPDRFIVIASLLLFGLLLNYINIEHQWGLSDKLYLFVITFLGTIANGGMSESKKWGYYLWILLFLLVAPIYILTHMNIEWALVINMLALILFTIWLVLHKGFSLNE